MVKTPFSLLALPPHNYFLGGGAAGPKTGQTLRGNHSVEPSISPCGPPLGQIFSCGAQNDESVHSNFDSKIRAFYRVGMTSGRKTKSGGGSKFGSINTSNAFRDHDLAVDGEDFVEFIRCLPPPPE